MKRQDAGRAPANAEAKRRRARALITQAERGLELARAALDRGDGAKALALLAALGDATARLRVLRTPRRAVENGAGK